MTLPIQYKYKKKEIVDQWAELDKQMPFKAVTGTLPVQRFITKESALEFFHAHKGRCVLSMHLPGHTQIIATKDN